MDHKFFGKIKSDLGVIQSFFKATTCFEKRFEAKKKIIQQYSQNKMIPKKVKIIIMVKNQNRSNHIAK